MADSIDPNAKAYIVGYVDKTKEPGQTAVHGDFKMTPEEFKRFMADMQSFKLLGEPLEGSYAVIDEKGQSRVEKIAFANLELFTKARAVYGEGI